MHWQKADVNRRLLGDFKIALMLLTKQVGNQLSFIIAKINSKICATLLSIRFTLLNQNSPPEF